METGKHGLKRELKLWDLVPMQIVVIVWLGWTGFAAKQGPTQLVLWLLAIALFYLPLAAVVMTLSRKLPVEGGVYQWVKVGVSPFAGYMAGWNFTVYALFAFAVAGSFFADGLAHALGPGASWMSTSRPFALALTAAACLAAFLLNVRGLHTAKWWSSGGALLTVVTFLALVSLLIRAWWLGLPSARASFSLAFPAVSIVTLNVFTKMAISALSGFDGAAIFSEECRKPENDVARSVLIAAPLIAVVYILGTNSVLAYIKPGRCGPVRGGAAGNGGGARLGRGARGNQLVHFLRIQPGVFCVDAGLCGDDRATTHGCRMGWPAAGLVERTACEVQDSMESDRCGYGRDDGAGRISLWGAGNQEAVQVARGRRFRLHLHHVHVAVRSDPAGFSDAGDWRWHWPAAGCAGRFSGFVLRVDF